MDHRHAQPVSRACERLDDRAGISIEIRLHETVHVRAGSAGIPGDSGSVFAGQHAPPERGPREDADPECFGGWHDFGFDVAVE